MIRYDANNSISLSVLLQYCIVVSIIMARKSNTSKKVAKYANQALKVSRNALLEELCRGMYEAYKVNGNRLPYRHLAKLLKEVQPANEWLTRNKLNKAFIKYRSKHEVMDIETVVKKPPKTVCVKKTSDSLLSNLSNVSSTITSNSNKPAGRPVGTTMLQKKSDEMKLIDAKNEIAQKYNKLREAAARTESRVKYGSLKKIIQTVKSNRNIKADISSSAIRKRVQRNSLVSHHVAGGQVSPLQKIEPIIIDIILQMARIRQCLSPSKGLKLVNSIIKGTNIQDELIKWKQKNTPNDCGTVGIGYWNKFLKRNKTKLVSRRGQKYELNRQNWTTYANFVHMYDHTISEMIECGVAIKLDTPVWMDRQGNICEEGAAFGCKVFHQLVRPDMCVCGDEVGGNLSMKGDGHIAGTKLLTGVGNVPKLQTSTRNRRFTMIGLTAFTGEPKMCIIILEGKYPKGHIEAGIDISVTPTGDNTKPEFILNNSGPGKYYPGGPECTFKGKKVPAFIRWHESASITTQILVEALTTLDSYQLFHRTNTVKPFLMLDGHKSRLELPFLQYINTPRDHWVVCIGVPYGTALWQVGDSKEQNGSFNIAMYRAKKDLLEKKDEIGMHDDGLVDTDLMPLINAAWKQSFFRIDKNKNALSDRGWNPLNKNLLLHEDLRATMTETEKSKQYHLSHQIIIPQRNIADVSTTSMTSAGEYTRISRSDSSSATFVHSNHPSDSSLSTSLNFSTGESLRCLKAILTQDQLHEARERIREDMSNGKSIKDQLKANSRLSAGILFKSGSTRLGKTVFDVCRENIEEKRKQTIDKMNKEKDEYNKNVENATKVWEKKGELEKMTIRELTIVCKPLKRKSDGKMPNKREELIAKFKEWHGRPTPVFVDDINVENSEISNDDNIDDVNFVSEDILCEVEI